MHIKKININKVYKDPVLKNRLRFLTNGAYGRSGSGMIDWIDQGKLNHVWALYHNGKIRGWACIADICSEAAVYVQKDYRSLGFGRALVKRMRAYAKKHIKRRVSISPWSAQGRKMYQAANSNMFMRELV